MRLSFLIVVALVLIFVPLVALAANPPSIETYPASETNTSYTISNIVTLSANVTATGGANVTARGFVYDIETHSMPQPSDNITATEYAYFVSESGDWLGGEYSDNITHLESDTRYFFRAVAYNDSFWGYGEEETFRTIAQIVEEDIGEVANELANLNALIGDVITFLLVVAVIALVISKGSIVLYAVGSPLCIVYGLSRATPDAELSMWIVGVVIAIIGTYFLYQISAIAFNWYKKARRKG